MREHCIYKKARKKASNYQTPAVILDALSKYGDTEVRIRVAWNANTSAHTLSRLAEDVDIEVLHGVAQNANTPVDILAKLVNIDFAKYSVAWNPNTSTEILLKLVDSDNIGVQQAVAQHPNSSVEVLTKLVSAVVSRPTNNLNLNCQYELNNNPNCPESIKIWVKNKGFAGIPLAEFMEKVGA